ncbi:MAG TPA: hypothetical protein PK807_05890 [Verrucomicrobiota bacterium]|jgi:hypothetical protein|nr:hypothetical protein [Verrucomicrobiota bacterium]
MSYVLQSKVGGDFKPHPEGIHPAICVDLIDLGLVESEWQGQRRLVNKLRLVFETEQRGEDGKNCIITKTFTASLHPKAKLSDFVGKWRGRPVVPGESIDLSKLIGANCTLVVSHQQNMVGRTYASIDAVSKPTKRLVASGSYDPALARQRIAEWKAREAGAAAPQASSQPSNGGGRPLNPVAAAFPQNGAAPAATPKSAAPPPAPTADFDPEVGF